MMEDYDKDELVEQYLQGGLKGEVLNKFRNDLAGNEELKREVAMQHTIIKNIKAEGRKDWARKLEAIHNEMETAAVAEEPVKEQGKLIPLKRVYNLRSVLAVAAMVIIIVFSAVLIFTSGNDNHAEQMFLAYYQPYPDLEATTRSLSPVSLTEKEEAFKAYNEHAYAKSISLFKTILGKQDDELILFYFGNACLAGGKPKEAETAFKKYLSRYKEFAVETKWYLSLSYLKQDKMKEAKILLEELAKEDNGYSKRAIEVLNNDNFKND